MSERGTFVTSFLYDYPTLIGPLDAVLKRVVRGGTALILGNNRWYSGMMHGGYPGEEAYEMQDLILEELVPALPEKHGQFSIAVMPENEEYSAVYSIKDRVVTKYALGPGEVIS